MSLRNKGTVCQKQSIVSSSGASHWKCIALHRKTVLKGSLIKWYGAYASLKIILSSSDLVTYMCKPTQEKISEPCLKSPFCQLTIMWPWGSYLYSVCFSFASLKDDSFFMIWSGESNEANILALHQVLLCFLLEYILSLKYCSLGGPGWFSQVNVQLFLFF